ncbi:hypothetical protein EDC02_5275 [Micromonospora sp. Llam0]|uniref:hypothetical protein n=1 Tax=Micromonospora sp. Llam0 TaxID=2485143 RepID=UPI000FB06B02|nr:hypothetical protein [Micromonospora sp. Llam0]ROO63254.1 hypothetical protein EDC02_5275 [Micromonospora sp. Llam0]
MTAADSRRFRIRPDAFFVRRPDGVRLSNNSGSFTIRGVGAYRLVAALFGSLDGERTLDDLVCGLPDAARRSVLELVATLDANGFLAKVRHPAEPVPDRLRRYYPAQLDFLELHAEERPVARFHRARSTPLLVAGRGVALTALLGALTDFGLARLHVVVAKSDDERVAQVLATAERRDDQVRYDVQQVDQVQPAELVDRAEQLNAPMVLLADEADDDPAAVSRLADAQARLRDEGRFLSVLGRCGDFTVALPGGSRSCWDCMHRWTAARAVATTGEPLPMAAAPAAIAALHLAQHAFAVLAGVPQPAFERIATIEPIAPVVRSHQPRRHPRCPSHRADPATAQHAAHGTRLEPAGDEDDLVRPDVPTPEDTADVLAVADRIVVACAGWTDPVVGPVLALGEEDIDQAPLAGSACRVARPDNSARVPRVVRIVCRAVSPREARNQVVLAAWEELARELADRAGLLAEGWYVGAGWSRAESLYRARLAAAQAVPTVTQAVPAEVAPTRAFPTLDDTTGPVGTFLASELATCGSWRTAAVTDDATGFVRVVLDTTTGIVTGQGLTAGHARDNALLRAVADGLACAADDGPVRAAHLAPPVRTWPEALAWLDRRTRWADGLDLGHLLGFLDDQAFVVAVPGVPA